MELHSIKLNASSQSHNSIKSAAFNFQISTAHQAICSATNITPDLRNFVPPPSQPSIDDLA